MARSDMKRSAQQKALGWDEMGCNAKAGWPSSAAWCRGNFGKSREMMPKSAAQANYCLRSAERWKDHGVNKESYYEHSQGLQEAPN